MSPVVIAVTNSQVTSVKFPTQTELSSNKFFINFSFGLNQFDTDHSKNVKASNFSNFNHQKRLYNQGFETGLGYDFLVFSRLNISPGLSTGAFFNQNNNKVVQYDIAGDKISINAEELIRSYKVEANMALSLNFEVNQMVLMPYIKAGYGVIRTNSWLDYSENITGSKIGRRDFKVFTFENSTYSSLGIGSKLTNPTRKIYSFIDVNHISYISTDKESKGKENFKDKASNTYPVTKVSLKKNATYRINVGFGVIF